MLGVESGQYLLLLAWDVCNLVKCSHAQNNFNTTETFCFPIHNGLQVLASTKKFWPNPSVKYWVRKRVTLRFPWQLLHGNLHIREPGGAWMNAWWTTKKKRDGLWSMNLNQIHINFSSNLNHPLLSYQWDFEMMVDMQFIIVSTYGMGVPPPLLFDSYDPQLICWENWSLRMGGTQVGEKSKLNGSSASQFPIQSRPKKRIIIDLTSWIGQSRPKAIFVNSHIWIWV